MPLYRTEEVGRDLEVRPPRPTSGGEPPSAPMVLVIGKDKAVLDRHDVENLRTLCDEALA